jgi:hypothetical protein
VVLAPKQGDAPFSGQVASGPAPAASKPY